MKREVSVWKKAGENLVRHRAGTYYLRAKGVGKAIRDCLETPDLRIANLKHNEKLAALRKAAAVIQPGTETCTLGDALDVASTRLLDRPVAGPQARRFPARSDSARVNGS